MKKQTIIRWGVVAFFGIMAVVSLCGRGFLSALLFILGGALIAPINVVTEFRRELKLSKAISILLAIALLLGGAVLMPNSHINISAIKNNNTQQEQTSETVYITKTGSKYHSTKSCSGLSMAKRIYESTLEDAENEGLEPCSKCY